MTERLTWKQVCERYPDEWVVLVETEWIDDTDFELCTSIVVGHFKSRVEATSHIQIAFERYSEVRSFWTGTIAGVPLRRENRSGSSIGTSRW